MTAEEKEEKKVDSENNGSTDPSSTVEEKPVEQPQSEDVKDSEEKSEEQSLVREFSVEVKKADIDAAFEEAVAKYATDIKLPGFRKGKVPLEVIRSRFNDAITEEVKQNLISEALIKKIDDEKMKIASQPQILKINDDEGKDLTADIRVEVMPEVELPDLETISVEIPAKELEIEPYDEEKTIENVLKSRQRQVPVINREIKDDDMVVMKYQSKVLQTKRMTPKKDSNYMVKKDVPFEIIDIYDDIIGKKIDDKLTIKRTYPDDYKKKIWAGKEIEHYIEIKSVFEMVTPELDEDFVKAQGFESVDDFKKKLKEEYENHSKKNNEEKRTALIMEKLSEQFSFPVPDRLLAEESARMLQYNPQAFQIDDEPAAMALIESLKPMAEKNIRVEFIMEAVKEKYKLEITGDDLEEEYKRTAENARADIKEVRKYFMKKENMQQLKESLLKTKAIDLLKEKINVSEV